MASEKEAALEKSARDSVNAALGGAEPSPKKAAGAIVQQISHAARASKDTREAVVAAVRGGIGAVLVSGVDLAETAVLTLESLSNMSLMMRVSPEDLMSWVMEGIASIAPMANPAVRDAIQNKIDEKFMGAGEVFFKFFEAALKQDRPS